MGSSWIELNQSQSGHEKKTCWVNVDSVLYIEGVPAGSKLYFVAPSETNAAIEQSITVSESPEDIFKKAKGGLARKF